MSLSKSSKLWLQEHHSDFYVKKSKADGYRSRAAYKLLALQEKDKIISSGMTVIDLGAAPGGWSQVAAKLVGIKGHVYALDILPMAALNNVYFIQGDFQDTKILDNLLDLLGTNKADVVISDMAPNISGIREVDLPRSMCLAELALEAALLTLKVGGSFVVKVFQGEGFDEYLRKLKASFDKVYSRKPAASRARSNEIYLLAKGYAN